MNIIAELKKRPKVEVEMEILERVLQNEMAFAQENIREFEDAIVQLAFYSIYKGNHKGNMIYLYMDAIFKDEDNPTVIERIYYGVTESGFCTGKDYGTFNDLEQAVKKFNSVSFKYECLPVFRMYEAKLKNEKETIQFSVSEIREVSLREEIKKGFLDIDLDSMKLIKETEDRNEARSMATEL
ncbi:hypothetical protein [Viridibacillus arvi]|uniref:hypothetical protein n=1 Tax=Viridibacillus arvi TaxID=263475 RepID=UPI0034CEAF7A